MPNQTDLFKLNVEKENYLVVDYLHKYGHRVKRGKKTGKSH